MSKNSATKIGLALGAGGVRGFAHLGVLEVLEREGIALDSIAGASVGAVVGAMYAFRPRLAPHLTHFRRYLSSDLYDEAKLSYLRQSEETYQNFYDRLRVRFAQGAVLATSLRHEALFDEQTLRSNVQFLVPPLDIEESFIQLAVVCFDLETGQEVVFHEGSLLEAAMASCAIPGIFPAVRIDDRPLMDGGNVNPVPCDQVRRMGADVVIGVDLTPQVSTMPKLTGSHEVAMRAADISRHHLKCHGLRQADVRISVPLSDVFWGDFSCFDHCVETGRQATEKALPAIREALQAA